MTSIKYSDNKTKVWNDGPHEIRVELGEAWTFDIEGSPCHNEEICARLNKRPESFIKSKWYINNIHVANVVDDYEEEQDVLKFLTNCWMRDYILNFTSRIRRVYDHHEHYAHYTLWYHEDDSE